MAGIRDNVNKSSRKVLSCEIVTTSLQEFVLYAARLRQAFFLYLPVGELQRELDKPEMQRRFHEMKYTFLKVLCQFWQ